MRYASLAIATALAFFLAACGSNATTTNASNESAIKAEEAKQEEVVDKEMSRRDAEIRSNYAIEKAEELTSGFASNSTADAEDGTLLANAEWPQNELTSLVPKPEFTVPIESVGVKDSEQTQSTSGGWRNATQEEVTDYVQKVKDAGFNVDMSESSDGKSYTFSAGNAKSGTNGRASIHVRYGDASDFTTLSICISRITF